MNMKSLLASTTCHDYLLSSASLSSSFGQKHIGILLLSYLQRPFRVAKNSSKQGEASDCLGFDTKKNHALGTSRAGVKAFKAKPFH